MIQQTLEKMKHFAVLWRMFWKARHQLQKPMSVLWDWKGKGEDTDVLRMNRREWRRFQGQRE